MGTLTPHLQDSTSVVVSFPIQEQSHSHGRYGRNVHRYRDGSVQAYNWRTTKLRAWKLTFKNMRDSEFDSLVTFLDTQKLGGVFYWDNTQTGEADIKVTLKNEPNFTYDGPRTRQVTIDIEETV